MRAAQLEPGRAIRHLPRVSRARPVSHQGGAGESGFCYEAGASVEVAPVDALGSGGWGQRRTPKRGVRWHSAAHGVEADVDNKSA